jgi:hypothetical protein
MSNNNYIDHESDGAKINKALAVTTNMLLSNVRDIRKVVNKLEKNQSCGPDISSLLVDLACRSYDASRRSSGVMSDKELAGETAKVWAAFAPLRAEAEALGKAVLARKAEAKSAR